MSLPATLPNPFLEAFTVGIIYGLVFCTSTCLPYLASYIAGRNADFRQSTKITLTFTLGRIIAYAITGATVATLSAALGILINQNTLTNLQQYTAYAFGAATIAIGITILYQNQKPKTCPQNPPTTQPTQKQTKTKLDPGALTLGLTRGLILCPPLIALLIYAIPFAGPLETFTIALLFGLGTAISPILILGGITGWLLNKAPLFRKYIAIAGAAALIALGAIAIINPILTA